MQWGRREALRAHRGWPLVAAGATVLLGVAGTASAFAAAAAEPQRVRIDPPVRPAGARDLGAVAAGVRMHVTVALKARNPAALSAYARAVATPGSSVYHRYLTPQQFAARFGATEDQLRRVSASLRHHGLNPGLATANRLSIPVSATAGQLERGFSVGFRRIALRSGRRAVVANAAPALDSAIAGDVQAVLGLSSVSSPRPLLARSSPRSSSPAAIAGRQVKAHAAGDAPQPCSAASAAAAAQGAYTADQIASAYRLSDLYASGAEGQGQTIAIYELESYDPSDIATYQSCYGTSASVSSVQVDGGSGGSGPGSGEAALDIENAIGLAPKASFLVYQGPNANSDVPGSGPYDTFSAIVTQDRAHVVSVSWGECEQLQGSRGLSAENTLFQEAATQGQSIVSATGDQGSSDCNGTNGKSDLELAVDDPGGQPFVTGVGGTSLASPGPPPSETVWNRIGNPTGSLAEQGGAGGGGISHAWQMPGYQKYAAGSLHVIGSNSSGSACGNAAGFCRQVPDVSANADPSHGYIIYWNGSGSDPASPTGWQAVGGTSAAAPVWAALLADANSSAACHGSAIGFANPALYAAAGSGYASYFNDVTAGNNDFALAHGGLYPAGVGYDMASGLGSPNAGALAVPLCADSLRVNDPGSQLSTVGQPVRLQVTTTGLAHAKLIYYSSHLPPGLSISKSTGRVTGRANQIGTWLVGIAALDQSLALRATFFTWRIVGAPSVSQVALSGVGAGRPRLGLTITSGQSAPALKAISIRLPKGLSFAAPPRKVSVTGSFGRGVAFSSQLGGGALRITLAGATPRIRITIRYSALRVTASLAAAVRRHRAPALTVTVQTLDASNHGVGASARIRTRG
jgi:subtilase family serine protease